MSENSKILQNIPDAKPVRVFLPLQNRAERYRVQGIYEKVSPPKFTLSFRPGILPDKHTIDAEKACIINVDLGGASFSMEARIEEMVGLQQLSMTALQVMSHEQMRDFFRVDAVTDVISEAFRPELKKDDESDWKIQGETIDISGSGLLATFPERPADEGETILTITIPSAEKQTIRVLAKPVRILLTSDKKYDIAYRFTDISTEDRDAIIGYCLELQRKLLRLKVQVKDQL